MTPWIAENLGYVVFTVIATLVLREIVIGALRIVRERRATFSAKAEEALATTVHERKLKELPYYGPMCDLIVEIGKVIAQLEEHLFGGDFQEGDITHLLLMAKGVEAEVPELRARLQLYRLRTRNCARFDVERKLYLEYCERAQINPTSLLATPTELEDRALEAYRKDALDFVAHMRGGHIPGSNFKSFDAVQEELARRLERAGLTLDHELVKLGKKELRDLRRDHHFTMARIVFANLKRNDGYGSVGELKDHLKLADAIPEDIGSTDEEIESFNVPPTEPSAAAA